MSLLEASLVAVDYANLEPEVPDKTEQQQNFTEEQAIATGKLSEKAKAVSFKDPLDDAMKIKKRPPSRVPSDTVFSDELEEEKEAIQF